MIQLSDHLLSNDPDEALIVDQKMESRQSEHTTVLSTSRTTNGPKIPVKEPPPRAATTSGGSGRFTASPRLCCCSNRHDSSWVILMRLTWVVSITSAGSRWKSPL
ncbi:hypothetical protein GBA52_004207 [Prunus armeniaca]|nr:hypothetical protein GBA52_004207 [Prunus armeniaca]